MARLSATSKLRRPRVVHKFAGAKPHTRARGEIAGIRLRWSRPWARCMPAILLWLNLPAAAPTVWSSQSFLIRHNLRPHEDLTNYPRTLRQDISRLAAVRTDLVWSPSVQVMYPSGFATRIVPEGPATAGLEDAFRPHFFSGVATVVAKLFIQCRPDVAIFGEKDYQQLKVVTQLARDLDLKTRVIGVPTIREKRRPRTLLAQRVSLDGRAHRCPRPCTAC